MEYKLIDVVSNSSIETKKIGFNFAQLLNKNDYVAINGDLGSGKTVLIGGIVNYFITDATVTSPTYSILNYYSNDNNTIYHIDAYRLSSYEDLLSCGVSDCDEGIFLIEWAENISDFFLKKNYYEIDLSYVSKNKRKIVIKKIKNEQ